MHTTIGFATIGTSKITRKFLSAAKECAGFKLAAVYSRDIKKAEQFAGEQGAERFYDSLDMLAAAKDVEAVYVASPNYMHYKHVMKLLKAGKHVFCGRKNKRKNRQGNRRRKCQAAHTRFSRRDLYGQLGHRPCDGSVPSNEILRRRASGDGNVAADI